MSNKSFQIRFVGFLGPDKPAAIVRFEAGVNLLYGASNTGKSFLLKTIDFMLGGTDLLPSISEREGYETVLLGLVINGEKEHTFSRSISGGGYRLFDSLTTEIEGVEPVSELAETATSKKVVSLSQFLLEELGFIGRKLAKNASGETDNISIRDFASYFLVDETTILSEKSPVEGDLGRLGQTKDRSFFRLLMSGKDDSAIVRVTGSKTFNANRLVRAEVVRELISSVDRDLNLNFPNYSGFPDQLKKLNDTLLLSQTEYESAEMEHRNLVRQKSEEDKEIRTKKASLEACQIHLDRFAKLDSVYTSDVARLKAVEEIGFILGRQSDLECDLCGAPPEAQTHNRSLEEIEKTRSAAIGETSKILVLQSELRETMKTLSSEADGHRQALGNMRAMAENTEQKLSDLKKQLENINSKLRDLLNVRDHVKEGISLQKYKDSLMQKLAEVEEEKNESLKDKPQLKVEDPTIYQFCITMGDVLKAWGFPGRNEVSFDDKRFDVRIDGKLRTDNGKGVRAVTHAAFKVAQLIFSKSRSLPHPGFLVLDSPLVTYRDPLKNKKYGALDEDEKALAATSLKARFFEHLSSIPDLGQIIVLENVDPPENIEQFASVQAFSGDPEFGRFGLFEVNRIPTASSS